uniref:Uncharacterized protein n=1 Tax=Cajanus cajan TaxID=3821 RepID=A0A151RQQ8_CAJCA|nr:hypothetical protein KK1_033658 [Cajanus cajan]
MASQGSESEIELVVDTTTSRNSVKNRESTSSMVAKRSIMSLNSILTKFHAGYFRISLSFGGQALLWKTLIEPTHDDTNTNTNTTTLLGAVRASQNGDVFGAVVGVCGAGGGAGREDLRAVVHEGEEVSIRCGEPHEPDVGDRELGGGTRRRAYGLEGECGWVVFAGDGALLGLVCDALSAFIG